MKTAPATPDQGLLTWTLRFDADGRGLTVWPGPEPQGKGEHVAGLVLGEPFEDLDGDGHWAETEEYEDLDEDEEYDPPEYFVDTNADGKWTPSEPFTDANGNRAFDANEAYEDLNGNETWDPAEEFSDRDGDGEYDAGEPFTDLNGNRRRDIGEPFHDLDADGRCEAGEPISVGGRAVTLYRWHGNPAGRTFRLAVRSIDATASWLRAKVSAEEVGQWTGIVELTSTASTPHQAQEAANAIAETFLALKQSRRELKADKLLEWLLREIDEKRSRLRTLAQARLDYIEKAEAVRLGERASGIYGQLEALRGERFALTQQDKQLRAGLAALAEGQSTDSLLTNVGLAHVDARTSALVQSLADLRVERAVLVHEGAQPGNQQLQLLDVRIKMTNEELDASVRNLVTQRRLELTRSLDSVQDLLQRAAEDQEKLDKLLAELPSKERKLLELAGPIEAMEATLEPLARWKQEAEIAMVSAVSSVYLVDSARLPAGTQEPQPLPGRAHGAHPGAGRRHRRRVPPRAPRPEGQEPADPGGTSRPAHRRVDSGLRQREAQAPGQGQGTARGPLGPGLRPRGGVPDDAREHPLRAQPQPHPHARHHLLDAAGGQDRHHPQPGRDAGEGRQSRGGRRRGPQAPRHAQGAGRHADAGPGGGACAESRPGARSCARPTWSTST